MRGIVAGLLAALALAPAAFAQPAPSAAPTPTGPLSIESQGSFFVGGRDIASEDLSTLPAYAPAGTITVDQMYVQYQVPAGGAAATPVVLIHGCCLTGTTWETTPDGRMGWAEYFTRRGQPTYVVDQVRRGRSAGDPSGINAVRKGAPAERLPTVFSASHESAWAIFRFGTAFPQTFPDLQFPVEAQAEFWKQMVPDYLASMPTPNPTVPALSALAQRLRGAVLISHSQSGIYPFQTAALETKGVAGIISVEPGACPDAAGDLAPYKGIPIMVLFGDYVEQFPRWAPRLVACRAFVEKVNAAGGKASLVVLPDQGIRGNSHMLMQDRNNLQIAGMLVDWMQANVRR
jgi:pimeloyl-ACP methyl ester carboxylesterase